MMKNHIRVTFVLLVLCLALGSPLRAQPGTETVPGTSTLVGKIFSADGKTPMAGARVIAYHLSSERVFTSAPTKSNGEFQIGGLPYGYFDLAIETPDGLFVGNQVINVAPASKSAVVFTLSPYSDTARAGRERIREFPGSDRPSTGMARVEEKLRGREFWRSPKGVAILAGGGGLALLAIAGGGGGSDNNASPSNP